MSIPFFPSNDPPTIITENGKKFMIVQQLGIELQLPPVNSEIFKSDDVNCNQFNVFRKLCNIALQSKFMNVNSVEVSYKAGKCWEFALDPFRDFFKNYTSKIKAQKPKTHKFKCVNYDINRPRRRRGPNKKTQKSDKVVTPLENNMNDNINSELDNFKMIAPCSFQTSSYSSFIMNNAKKADDLGPFNAFDKI